MKAAIAAARHRHAGGVLHRRGRGRRRRSGRDADEARRREGVQRRLPVRQRSDRWARTVRSSTSCADGGVAVCAFNPINPLERPGHWGLVPAQSPQDAGGWTATSRSRAASISATSTPRAPAPSAMRAPQAAPARRTRRSQRLARHAGGGARAGGGGAGGRVPRIVGTPGLRRRRCQPAPPPQAWPHQASASSSWWPATPTRASIRPTRRCCSAIDASQRSIQLTMAYFSRPATS